MKFPKLGLKPPKKIVPELTPDTIRINPVAAVKTPSSNFTELKRTLAKERNITKKFKL